MAVSQYKIERFGGLVLDREPDEVGANEAIDLVNVDLDRGGAMRIRDGFSKLNAVAGADPFVRGPYNWEAQNWVVVSDGTKVRLYDSAGTLQASSGAMTADTTSVAPFGTGTTSYLYLAQSKAASVFRATTAGVFSTPAGMPNAEYLAVQPNDNRLVAAYTSSTQASRVKFSDPGDAETWGANNYVDLTPNDGDVITGLVAWGNLLFVFKQRKYFVFYGNSTDSAGNPVFNYRAFDFGIGTIPGRNPCVATPNGVYFMGAGGVYVTTGGAPSKVSGAMEPLFTGAPIPFGPLVPPLTGVSVTAAYLRGRVYFLINASGSIYLLGYDIETGQWVLWKSALITLPIGVCSYSLSASAPRLCFAYGTFLYTQPYVSGTTTTTDDGTPITSRYRSGFYTPLDDPARECTVRESILDGIGTPTFSVSRDFASTLPATGGGAKGTVTLGTSPAIAQGRHRVSQRGRRFSYQIESSTAGEAAPAWRVESITQNLTGFRETGLKTT